MRTRISDREGIYRQVHRWLAPAKAGDKEAPHLAVGRFDVPTGLCGIARRTFAYAYSQYTVPEPKDLANNQVSTIYAGDNQTQLARLVPPEGNRTHVTLDEIPEYVQDSVLAAEDRDFWDNSGFSFTGLGRAVVGKVTGNEDAGGGSTITQQYVKTRWWATNTPTCARFASSSTR